MNFLTKLFKTSNATPPVAVVEPLRLACRADLWCRKRSSISTLLDPELFDRYRTEVDRIDEDWVIQSNPPCAFKAEFKEGCDTLFELLQLDAKLHATKGWLTFTPPSPVDETLRNTYMKKLAILVRTAERELRPTA